MLFAYLKNSGSLKHFSRLDARLRLVGVLGVDRDGLGVPAAALSCCSSQLGLRSFVAASSEAGLTPLANMRVSPTSHIMNTKLLAAMQKKRENSFMAMEYIIFHYMSLRPCETKISIFFKSTFKRLFGKRRTSSAPYT